MAQLFDTADILPDPPVGDDGEPLEILHNREYRVQAYRKPTADGDVLVIHGAVRDQKPPGLYIEGDPDPLTIHHMRVELEVEFPTLVISAARVRLLTHPEIGCPAIEQHYANLVGLSIARGFTHKVRELFGGPRGCTHTTALLQAMAPVAIQSIWSLRTSQARLAADDAEASDVPGRDEMWAMNVNTCHVWAEDGETVARLRAGGEFGTPLFAVERMVSLGLKPEEWDQQMRSR